MRHKAIKRTVLVSLLLLLLIAGGFYAAVAMFYEDHFFKGTTINGIDISDYTVEKVKKLIESETGGYTLAVSARGPVTETISGDAIDMAPVWDGSIDAYLEAQNGFAWFLKEFQPDSYTSETIIGYNKDKLAAAVASLSFMDPDNQTAPVDAGMTDYVEGQGYLLIPSEAGTVLDADTVYRAIEAAVDGLLETLDLETIDCYAKPAVADDDEELNRRLGILNQFCEAKITYTVGDDVFDLDADTYHEWFVIADDGSVTFDWDMVRAYVVALGHKYNTCYATRNFLTSYGETVKITNSDYGWKVDYNAETDQVLAELYDHVVTTRDLNYLMVANSHNSPDYGDSYVEINLTAQHLFMYKDGELLVESDFVSGNLAKGNGTPSGIFSLTYKKRDATLRGATYESHVDYWMPFNGNIGMHDASWRSKFGAAIYMRNGSHGCINMPKSAAETMYEAISKDYPVIVYELEGTESEKGKAQIAAYEVIDLIDAIGEVTMDSEEAVTAARTAYDALNKTGKNYVKNAEKLTNAEKALKKLKKDDKKGGGKDKKPDGGETDGDADADAGDIIIPPEGGEDEGENEL